MEICGSMLRTKVIVQNVATAPESVSNVFHDASDSSDTKNLDSFLIVIIAACEDIVVDAVSNLLTVSEESWCCLGRNEHCSRICDVCTAV